MAGRDDSQERTETATPKHLREAREKGDVPRSQDLSAALVVLAVVGSLIALHSWLWTRLETVMGVGLSYDFAKLARQGALLDALGTAGTAALEFLAVPAGAALLGALLAPVLIGGFTFSAEALTLKPERLNPAEGFKRMLSLRSVVELAKSILKVTLIGGVLALVLWHSRGQLLAMEHISPRRGIAEALHTLGHASLLFAVALGAVAAGDVAWQRFDYARRMKMTRQEQRDENKETEGNPETRGRVRNLQRQMAQRRMMQAVPGADAVVANPAHFAVALRYDEAAMHAPKVVAKGLDLLALEIRNVAGAHHVPIVVAAPLARALYHTTRIDHEIPTALYAAVAQILAYVYGLRRADGYGEEAPAPPNPEIDPKLLGPYRLPARGRE
jgi:flagellar biosynthetic protein FlhB